MANKKVLWIILAISLTVFVGIGCGREVGQEEISQGQEEAVEEEIPTTAKVEQSNLIKMAMRDPKTLNPILNMDKTVNETLKLIFGSLIEFDQNDQVVPSLAESWQVSSDGTVVDIKLNPGIKWHDGQPLKAEDVIFSIKAIQEAEQSPYKSVVRNIVSYTALENNGLQIIYKEPFSGYAHTLYFPVIPAHVAQIGDHPIGTGPYLYETSSSNGKMILKPNPHYFKGEPKIGELEVLFTPDPESDLYSFDQGLIDVVSTDVIDWEKYGKNKKSNIAEYMTLNYDYIGLNFNKAVFQDLKMRQALLYATNREYLLEKFYLYHGQVVDVPVSPESWLYEPKSKKYEADADQAKQLLAGKETTIELLVNKDNVQRKNVAGALEKMYKDVGIDLHVLEVEEAVFLERVQNRQYDMFLGGWDFSVVPDMSFIFHSGSALGGANYGNYSSEKMDILLKEASNAKSNEQLKEAYSKLQLYIGEELPYLSLHFRTAALITNEKIKGVIKPHHTNIYQNIHEWYID